MILRELVALLRLDATKFTSGANEAAASSKKLEDALKEVNQTSTNSSKALDSMWSGITKGADLAVNTIKWAALGIVGSLTAATYAASKFESAMYDAWLQATNGAKNSGEAWEQFKDSARATAGEVGTSATKIASMYEKISDAGYDMADTMKIGGEAAKLAKALNLDYASAGDTVARAMTVFADENLSAAEVTNYLAEAAINGALKVDELGFAFNTLLPQAANLGWKFSDVVGVMGKLSERMSGFRAISAMTSVVSQLSDTSSGLGKALEGLGIKTLDSRGKMRPMIDILMDMQRKGEKVKEAFKGNAMMENVVNALLKTDLRGIRSGMSSTMPGQGPTLVEETVSQRQSTLASSLEEFGGAFEQVWSKIGEGFEKWISPMLQDMTKKMLKVVDVFKNTKAIEKFFEGLKTAYDKNIGPMIEEMFNKFIEWLATLTPEKVEAWATSVVNACSQIAEAIKGLIGLATQLMNLLSSGFKKAEGQLQGPGEKAALMGGGVVAGGMLGAYAGSVIAPGIGTAIGGIGGALLGGTLGGGIVDLTNKVYSSFGGSTGSSGKTQSQILGFDTSKYASSTVSAISSLDKNLSSGFSSVTSAINKTNSDVSSAMKAVQSRFSVNRMTATTKRVY